MNTTSIGWPSRDCPGTRPMYASARSAGPDTVSGTRPRTGTAIAGVRAVRDHRLQRGRVEAHDAVERGTVVGRQGSPGRNRPLPGVSPRRLRAAPRGTRTSSRPERPCPPARRPRSTCCRPSCAPRSTGDRTVGPRYSITCPAAPSAPRRAISARLRSFAVTPGPQASVHLDRERAGPLLEQALRREHLRDLAGADAERQRAQRAVRAGVAVAADDRAARLREAQLRARSRARCPAGRGRARTA